jgi:hypothetical protein
MSHQAFDQLWSKIADAPGSPLRPLARRPVALDHRQLGKPLSRPFPAPSQEGHDQIDVALARHRRVSLHAPVDPCQPLLVVDSVEHAMTENAREFGQPIDVAGVERPLTRARYISVSRYRERNRRSEAEEELVAGLRFDLTAELMRRIKVVAG